MEENNVQVLGVKKDALQELQFKHRTIVILHSIGVPTVQIAKEVGLSDATVNKVIASPLAKKALEDITLKLVDRSIDVRAAFMNAGPEAAEKLIEIMRTTPNVAQQLKAIEMVLKMGGYEPPTKHLHGHVVNIHDAIEEAYEKAQDIEPYDVIKQKVEGEKDVGNR